MFLEDLLEDAVAKRGWTPESILKVVDAQPTPFEQEYISSHLSLRPAKEIPDPHQYDLVASRLFLQTLTDLELLAIQLHADREKIYEQYDKNKTESDFRAAIAGPIVFVAIVLMVRLITEGQPFYAIATIALALPISYRLGSTACVRLLQANDAVLNALRLGHIKSPRLKVFEEDYRPRRQGDIAI